MLAIGDCLSELHRLDERILEYDRHLSKLAQEDDRARQLMALDGVGETTEFKSSRQFAAWIGLVPGQYSSGGKARLGRITKAGDPYLRSLLVMGARSVLNAAQSTTKPKTDPVSRWAVALAARRGYRKARVAIAAKNARMMWAILRQGEKFVRPS